MYRVFLSSLALLATASAATISIDVGEDGALKFDPDSVTANVGDTLEFHFYSGSGGHSVVSSSFSTPCQPATSAFFSGYIPGDSTGDMTFVVPVNSTDPIWFYCSLGQHCQSGMVGVVNPPSGQTVSDFANAAQSVREASAPAALVGGVLTSIAPGAESSAGSSVATSSSAAESTNTSGTSVSSSTAKSSTAATHGAGSSTGSGVSSHAASTALATTTGTKEPTSTSAGVTAATTSASVGSAGMGDKGAVLGLAVFAGGLVALMA